MCTSSGIDTTRKARETCLWMKKNVLRPFACPGVATWNTKHGKWQVKHAMFNFERFHPSTDQVCCLVLPLFSGIVALAKHAIEYDPCSLSYTRSTAQVGGGSFKDRKPTGKVGCCESRMAERIHRWTERWLELYFLEWLQWLQWSPHPQLLDVVWCSAVVVVA